MKKIVTKIVFLLIFLISTNLSFSQTENKGYSTKLKKHLLDSLFPIEEIISITVENNSAKHLLSKKQILKLKQLLLKARYSEGLQLKPGHIKLSIKLASKSLAKIGFVYAYNGNINFDGGIDRFGNRFSGTYLFPLNINFDNY